MLSLGSQVNTDLLLIQENCLSARTYTKYYYHHFMHK
jgi:hypothetical protein